ncbi:hypothetical protein GPECTOR_506g471 [Gonium pectorale]|uniref:Pherophorin domain-containing protein n=1 Tax=Gonium pectorale TaxID=33097 RepID=A0A150FUV1_GONPE|nr:hypothetical protein GPECTOR_506g471 [Gonium pectorale]|eukprot:KXZ41382.1 hypothetical protein GPECTOR_506g471 [Gonium pectorale]
MVLISAIVSLLRGSRRALLQSGGEHTPPASPPQPPPACPTGECYPVGGSSRCPFVTFTAADYAGYVSGSAAPGFLNAMWASLTAPDPHFIVGLRAANATGGDASGDGSTATPPQLRFPDPVSVQCFLRLQLQSSDPSSGSSPGTEAGPPLVPLPLPPTAGALTFAATRDSQGLCVYPMGSGTAAVTFRFGPWMAEAVALRLNAALAAISQWWDAGAQADPRDMAAALVTLAGPLADLDPECSCVTVYGAGNWSRTDGYDPAAVLLSAYWQRFADPDPVRPGASVFTFGPASGPRFAFRNLVSLQCFMQLQTQTQPATTVPQPLPLSASVEFSAVLDANTRCVLRSGGAAASLYGPWLSDAIALKLNLRLSELLASGDVPGAGQAAPASLHEATFASVWPASGTLAEALARPCACRGVAEVPRAAISIATQP